MRVTHILLRQHIGWHFKKHWLVQGKKRVVDTGVEKRLRQKGIIVEDANEFLRGRPVYERFQVVGYKDVPQPMDETHPNWHNKSLLTFKDNNVLLEGLNQAKILTNTIQIEEGLPNKYVLQDVKKEFNRKVKKIIQSANIFDAEQKKLPKIIDPARPAHKFPRKLGITQNRALKVLISKLLNLVELTSDLSLARQRYLVDKMYFSFPFERTSGHLIQFELTGDTVILSEKPLSAVTNQKVNEFELPDLFPIHPTVTLNEDNIYVIENIYPVDKQCRKHHPHTLFINYDREEVKNIYEEEVTDEQIHARSLLKTFTAAASYARNQFGNDVKTLPSPVTLQAIQTDGRLFYFGVLQLNTLDLESSNTRNIWYQTGALALFDKCSYELGKPVLEGYNQEVVKHIVAFYNNV